MSDKVHEILSNLMNEPIGTRFNVKVDSIPSVKKLQKRFNKIIEFQRLPITVIELTNSTSVFLVRNESVDDPVILEVINLSKDL